MADIDVKELAVLNAYSSKINDFKTGTTAVGALIDRQIRKIKDDLANKKNQASNSMNFVEEQADKVISRYDYALGKCENARLYIGETDLECKSKIKDAELIVERINDKIRQLSTELENAGLHTKNFCLQVLNMTEACQNKMKQNITALEEYRDKR